MDLDLARDFIRDNHRGVLATRHPGGGIRQSPIVAALDDAGRIVVSSRETAYKVRYLRADPWAQACVVTDRFFGPWVWVEGTAEIASLPEAMEPPSRLSPALRGRRRHRLGRLPRPDGARAARPHPHPARAGRTGQAGLRRLRRSASRRPGPSLRPRASRRRSSASGGGSLSGGDLLGPHPGVGRLLAVRGGRRAAQAEEGGQRREEGQGRAHPHRPLHAGDERLERVLLGGRTGDAADDLPLRRRSPAPRAPGPGRGPRPAGSRRRTPTGESRGWRRPPRAPRGRPPRPPAARS